jgi:radical SAM superfamily enzyme YgiQ (UPF0313 family)
MRKTPFRLFTSLKKRFDEIMKQENLNFELIPYFISSHPGCGEEDMAMLAAELKTLGLRPEQVQDFTPSPMTLSTAMYYTGFDPYSGKKLFVARSTEEKRSQKDYFFWYIKEVREKISKRLIKMGRRDLLDKLTGRIKK